MDFLLGEIINFDNRNDIICFEFKRISNLLEYASFICQACTLLY